MRRCSRTDSFGEQRGNEVEDLRQSYWRSVFAVPATWLAGAVRRRRGHRVSASNALDFILASVVLPLERLEIAEFIAATLRHWDDVIDFPTVTASGISKILADNGPTPGIHAQGFIDAHRSCLLPYRFDDLRGERIAIGICVRLSLHR